MNTRTCYIAGPMRGIPAFNFPAFDAARKIMEEKGWIVISPADMDRDVGFDPSSLAPDTKFTPADNRKFYTRDSAALLSLRPENGDAIVFLEGWNPSTGAIAEFAIGKWIGLDRYELHGAKLTSINDVKLVPDYGGKVP